MHTGQRGRPLTGRRRNRLLATLRSPIERTFGTWKRWYGDTRVRYRGLAQHHTASVALHRLQPATGPGSPGVGCVQSPPNQPCERRDPGAKPEHVAQGQPVHDEKSRPRTFTEVSANLWQSSFKEWVSKGLRHGESGRSLPKIPIARLGHWNGRRRESPALLADAPPPASRHQHRAQIVDVGQRRPRDHQVADRGE